MAECLTDHGVRVDLLDEIKDILAFVLPAKHHHHLDFLFAVPAFAVQDRYTASHLRIDGIGNGFMSFRDNHELNRLPVAVENVVEHHTCHHGEDHTINNQFRTVEQNVTGADDGNIDELHNATHTEPAVFVHHRYDDIGAASRTVVGENYAQACTAKHGSDNQVHEPVVAGSDEGKRFEQRLSKGDYTRKDTHADDGPDKELSAEGLEGYEEQYAVEYPDHHGRIPAERIVKQRSDTGHTAHDNSFRKDEACVSDAVQADADEDEEIVFQIGG